MKNRKGFTLIEIMIVVAIIGILALVLVPKIAGMKDQAKLAGMDTNLRVTEAIVQKVINDYTTAGTGLADLETELADRFPTDVANPFTDAKNVGTWASVSAGTTSAAFVPLNLARTSGKPGSGDPAPAIPTVASPNTARLRGIIGFQAYTTNATSPDVNVMLVPYDDKGNVMTGKIKVITK